MRRLRVTKQQYTDAKVLAEFVPRAEMQSILHSCRGDESEFFFEKIAEMASRIREMPETYGQQDAEDPVVSLHYFLGNMDYWITEKDINADGEGQRRAFGWADHGYGGELGYISIVELIENGVELDLYFEPQTLSAVHRARRTS